MRRPCGSCGSLGNGSFAFSARRSGPSEHGLARDPASSYAGDSSRWRTALPTQHWRVRFPSPAPEVEDTGVAAISPQAERYAVLRVLFHGGTLGFQPSPSEFDSRHPLRLRPVLACPRKAGRQTPARDQGAGRGEMRTSPVVWYGVETAGLRVQFPSSAPGPVFARPKRSRMAYAGSTGPYKW